MAQTIQPDFITNHLTMKAKSKALQAMKIDESKGIKEYKQDIKKSKGKERETYKEILPDEKKHLKLLKQL